jgi:hypothetical protein
MNPEKRPALEAAGFVFEDAEDFLELTVEERRLVELRLAVSRAVRKHREQQKLTQGRVGAEHRLLDYVGGVQLAAEPPVEVQLGQYLEVLAERFQGFRRVSGHGRSSFSPLLKETTSSDR